jgi:hypothetical protein
LWITGVERVPQPLQVSYGKFQTYPKANVPP